MGRRVAIFLAALTLFVPLHKSVQLDQDEVPELVRLIEPYNSYSNFGEPGFQDGSIFTYSTIDVGQTHSCAILDDGRLTCWGDNCEGQLGLGYSNTTNCYGNHQSQLHHTFSWSTPQEVNLGNGSKALQIALGNRFTCAILNEGSVKCWGTNYHGQLGIGHYPEDQYGSSSSLDFRGRDFSSPQLVDLGLDRSAVAISAGAFHTCAILDDGSVKCWGANTRGQLGLGYFNNSTENDPPPPGNWNSGEPSPQLVDLGPNRTAVAISAGSYHTCAILDNSSLKCWGENGHGQLGRGYWTDWIPQSDISTTTPRSVDFGLNRTAVAVSSGDQNTCAILDDGSLKCWGINHVGALGLGFFSSSNLDIDPPYTIPQNVNLGNHSNGTAFTAVSITVGGGYVCAIIDDGSLKCWGSNYYGQIGDGTNTNRNTPSNVNLPQGRSALAVAAGGQHTCAILDDTNLNCWGNYYGGRLGLGWSVNSNVYSANNAVSLPNGSFVKISERDIDADGILNIFDTHIPGDDDGDGVENFFDDFPENPVRAVSCLAGTYGRYTCVNSSPGHFAPIDDSMFTSICTAGTYQPDFGQTSCIEAGQGYYVDSAAAVLQTSCEPGTWQDQTGSTSCNMASPGHYVYGLGATSQNTCTAGYYQPNSGQTSCVIASSGYFVANPASTSQTICNGGTYQPNSGQRECLDADPGHYVPNQGATNQTQCSIGNYQPSSGQWSCVNAELDHYVDDIGAKSQTPCPERYITLEEGTDSLDYCYLDTDGDRIPNFDDDDDDDDGWLDTDDAFPLNDQEKEDTDGDGIGNNADICPGGDDLIDADNDDVPDYCDQLVDSDGDGYDDATDAFPGDITEWIDSDGDGVGNNADDDDDGDGWPDAMDIRPLDPEIQSDLDLIWHFAIWGLVSIFLIIVLSVVVVKKWRKTQDQSTSDGESTTENKVMEAYTQRRVGMGHSEE